MPARVSPVQPARHRVWRYSIVAWVALVVIPISYAVWRWHIGIGRDPDMSGVGELVAALLFYISLPMAALAFGVFAPLAIALDYIVAGRVSRVTNVLLATLLGVPALELAIIVTGWPEHSFAEVMSVIRHSAERAPQFVAATLVAGMIVGLGLRRRRSGNHT